MLSFTGGNACFKPLVPGSGTTKSVRFSNAEVIMGYVEKIEAQIAALPEADLRIFREWFTNYDAARWDSKIDADAISGKLDVLAEEALIQFRDGQCKRL